jgi:ABC-type glycerol-3-phosphate transport system substrate-binding protein
MKRLFTVSMFFFVLALLFASGGKEGGGGSIKVWTYWDEIPAYQTWYDHIGAFKKANPGIELQVQFVSYNQMKDQLTVASMSGSLPDVMQMDYSWIISFANMGGLADVTDRFASSKSLDKKRYFKGPLDMCTVKGHMFAIPQDANNTALYYNKDMLAKAGLSNPPGTWAQLAEYAKKMSGGQIYGYCLSLNDPSIAVYEFMPYVWGGGGTDRGLEAVPGNGRERFHEPGSGQHGP